MLLAIVALAACATTDEEWRWKEPAPIPIGWIHDYDYKSSLVQYLRSHYAKARSEGSTAYVYFYDDDDRHCRGTRRIMNRSEVAPVLKQVRIAMLSFERLKALQESTVDGDSSARIWTPAIVKVSPDGRWTSAVFFPDKYVFHRAQPHTAIYRPLERPQTKHVIELADALKGYFEANNEI